jgi:2-iminobutanoate/2-iminopropanoate deaminase
MKEIINPGTPVAGPYSPGIKIGNTLYISGQGWAQVSADIAEQTYQTLNNIKKILNAAGCKVSDIVNTIVYLKKMTDFSEMNKTYMKFFEENGVKVGFPARATIEVANLPISTMLIEISAIAILE